MIYEEVVQDSPWSSGPMIFTHFKVTMVKVDRDTNYSYKEIQRTEEGFYFSWMKDPSIHDEEYDAITGKVLCMTDITRIIQLLEENGYEEIGTYLDDEDVDNNYISFEKDTPEGLIITNVTNNRVYQIFHDLKGKIELEAGYGYDVFLTIFNGAV